MSTEAMDAGHGLDCEIHSRVFGRVVLGYREMRDEAVRVWDTQPQCVHFSSLSGFYAERIGGGIVCVQTVPRYSTSIEDAWLVIEAMIETGHSPHLQYYRSRGTWRAEFSLSEHPANDVFADTAPLAICLAALASQGDGPA